MFLLQPVVAVGAQALIPDARPAGEGVLRRGCVCGSRVKCTHLFNIRKAAAKVISIFNSCRGFCGRKGSDNLWMRALGGTVSIVSLKMTVCHNGQSAALLSSSGLVMYFSTLPAPSSSAPCILTILTHLRVCVKICILTHPLQGRCLFRSAPAWRHAAHLHPALRCNP